MKLPTATYRIQFRGGMTFDRAAALAPYLKGLGVSHLYASPVFAAARGSTHGYDVVDHNTLDPALGGRAGFERMSDALKAEGLGLILDIVPNHMAASLENPWWRSVVEWGAREPPCGPFRHRLERAADVAVSGTHVRRSPGRRASWRWSSTRAPERWRWAISRHSIRSIRRPTDWP